jgi:class 3 adenylate cyclase
VAVVLLVPAVIVWRAAPAASKHRLSLKDAERACIEVAAHHGGRVSGYTGDSVRNAFNLSQANLEFHLDAAAFLLSIPKSGGVAECSVLGSDLAVCVGEPLATVLATPDGRRSVSWCPPPSP